MIPLDKKAQRRAVLEQRNTLTHEMIEQKSKRIVERLKPYIKGMTALYNPFGSEVDIKAVYDLCEAYALPYVQGNNMIFYQIDKHTKFKKSMIGIMEPITGCIIKPADFGTIIIPMVAFDPYGNRIGYGKGYYDRFLKQTRAIRIGVAFECQKIDMVLCDGNDERLDYVLTESAIYQMK